MGDRPRGQTLTVTLRSEAHLLGLAAVLAVQVVRTLAVVVAVAVVAARAVLARVWVAQVHVSLRNTSESKQLDAAIL